jgi:glutaredoxin
MKVTVLFTMKGCPFCTSIKEEFKKNNIEYLERDIHENESEYDKFVELTENEFIPAMMLLTIDENEKTSNIKLLAPDRDFQDIYEGVEMVKSYLLD